MPAAPTILRHLVFAVLPVLAAVGACDAPDPAGDPAGEPAPDRDDAQSAALAALDPELVGLPLQEIERRLAELKQDRGYWDLTEAERARFDGLAVAREVRLGLRDAEDGAKRALPGLPLPDVDWPSLPPLPPLPPQPPLPPEPDPDEPDPESVRHVYRDLAATPIYRRRVRLEASRRPHRFRTDDVRRPREIQLATLPDVFIGADTTMVVTHDGESWVNDDCRPATRASCVTTGTDGGWYTIYVFATEPDLAGTTDVWLDRDKLADDAAFGGTLIELQLRTNGPYALQTVQTPGGASDTQLALFEDDWTPRGWNDDGGVGSAARIGITPDTPGFKLLVGATAPWTQGVTRQTDVIIDECPSESGACHLVHGATPDRRDDDRDRLSNELELELGTDPHDHDSDDDGLFDYWEVIGHHADGDEEPLVSRGADPLRRDIFLEIDGQKGEATATMESAAVSAQTAFWDLPNMVNPDGSTGMWLHVDLGAPCSDYVLCGDWGGADLLDIDDVSYYKDRAAVKDNFTPARWGLYHYGYKRPGVSAQSGGTPFWGIRLDNGGNWRNIPHELGHNLGLRHWGHQGPGRNFKNVYPSLMNYLFDTGIPGMSNALRFSEGLLETIDHRAVTEQGYSPGVDKSWMEAWPVNLDLFGPDDVDFNGDGRISETPVMADVGPYQTRGGRWPEVRDAREFSDRVPTGGGALVVTDRNEDDFWAELHAFVPFEHDDGVYPDVSRMDGTVGQVAPWSDWETGVPLPGGGRFDGEAAAAQVSLPDIGEVTVVVFPNADDQLHWNFYWPEHGFSNWTPIPRWPEGARARHASVAVIDGALTVVFRDFSRADDVPNTYLTRLSSRGRWEPWTLLPMPSFTTPGIVEAVDGNEYLAYVLDNDTNSVRFARRRAGSSDVWEHLPGDFQQRSTYFDDIIPPGQRTRINLLFRPYREAWGVPFEDRSGYLALYWVAGDPFNKGSWRQYRSKMHGYISPTDELLIPESFGWKAQEYVSRPFWYHSVAVAERHWNVAALYTSIDWGVEDEDIDSPHDRANGVFYVPYASGTPPMPPITPLSDHDDAVTIMDNMCISLRMFTGDICRCDEGPDATCPDVEIHSTPVAGPTICQPSD